MSLPVAIIGCGAIGTKRAIHLPPEMAVRSVFDSDVERARGLAASLANEPLLARSAEEAFEAARGGLAVVATSHDSLAPMTVAALRSGLHVLVEKPGARSLDELLEVERVAHGRGRIVRVGLNHRFHPSFAYIRRTLATEDVGALMHIRGRYGHGGRLGYEQEWRADRSISGGGELLDQGVHLIDLTRSFAGDLQLEYVELRTDFWDMEVEDNAFLALRCADGGFAWLHASWTEWRNLFSFEMAYERAKFEVTGLGGSYGVERLTVHRMLPELGPPETLIREWPREDRSWTEEMQDVGFDIAGSHASGATISDAIATMTIVQEAYRR